MSVNDEPTVRRFSGLADVYDRYRPRYPAATIAAILTGLPPNPLVIDIGAGTGISTRALIAAGARAIAIEPNDDMRAFATASGLDARSGSATQTGFSDASVDAVASFQAFHWFANAEALGEFRRVLRPGGRVALVWNERDREDPFTRDFRALEERYCDESRLAGADFVDATLEPLLAGAGFTTIRKLTFENHQLVDLDGLLGRVRSMSYVPRSGPVLDAYIVALTGLHERYARDDGTVALRYVTELYGGDLPQ